LELPWTLWSGPAFRLVEPPLDRPWGLRDFRVADPDGYYLRVTTRSPETSEVSARPT
jgi:hypothetical protein